MKTIVQAVNSIKSYTVIQSVVAWWPGNSSVVFIIRPATVRTLVQSQVTAGYRCECELLNFLLALITPGLGAQVPE